MEKSKNSVRFLTEASIMIALATVLSMIKVFKMPQGGSITAGSMIPIILIALRWGTLRGILVGLAYGVLQSIVEPYVVHPVQYILDYPLAFGLLGLAGLGKELALKLNAKKDSFKEYIFIITGIFLGILGRFISHVLAGVVFFSENAESLDSWTYSMGYNGSYLGVELLISILIIILIWGPLKRHLPN